MNTFKDIQNYSDVLADLISDRKDILLSKLSNWESRETALDEIAKSTDTFRNVGLEQTYIRTLVESIAVFMPLNLPLYSLTLFALIPSMIGRVVHVRTPTILRTICRDICQVLNLDRVAANVCFHELPRQDFVERYVTKAEVVLFTGKLENANVVRKRIRRDCIFIFNGRGINPIVIAKDADLSLAVPKTVGVKVFNSGQDCAAPDMVFVHKSIAQHAIKLLGDELGTVKYGDYQDPAVRVGRLLELNQLEIAAKFLVKHSDQIREGGAIDFHRQIVSPTLIAYDDSYTVNYKELFSPILFVSVYEHDEELQQYFEADQYKMNAMYCTLFGTSDYIRSQNHSIVLSEKVILDVERGNQEYGGYAHGASFVEFNKSSVAKPILVSREICTYKRGTKE